MKNQYAVALPETCVGYLKEAITGGMPFESFQRLSSHEQDLIIEWHTRQLITIGGMLVIGWTAEAAKSAKGTSE